jgi:hypothetical protein
MDPKQKEHYLSFLDQQPHIRNFGRTLTIFPFTDVRRPPLAFDTLRKGLASTFEHSPHLAGTLSVPDATTGQLRLEYPRHIDVHHEAKRVFNDSFDVATEASFAYSALSAVHFEPSLFPAEVFCPKLLANHPGLDAGDPYAMGRTSFANGVALPVMAAQVTFIPGGLVISLWMHHSVSDGLGASKLYEMWSRDVRERRVGRFATAIQEGDKGPDVGPDNKLEIARALDNLARTSTLEPQISAQEPTTATLHGLPYDVNAALFRFTHSTIVNLSVQLSSLTQIRISAFAALAALLWAHAIRARRIPPAFPTSTLAVVVDLRSRLGAPFTDPNYTENCVLCAKPTCDIPSSLPTIGPLTAADIAPLASIISTSLTGYTADVIKARLATLIKSTTSPPAIDCQDLRFANGPDLYITDWRRLGLDNEWDIPGTGSSKPVAIRRACWKGEGGIVVLPRRKGEDADWEAMVSLEEGDLARLRAGLKDGGWLVREMDVEVEVEPGRARL